MYQLGAAMTLPCSKCRLQIKIGYEVCLTVYGQSIQASLAALTVYHTGSIMQWWIHRHIINDRIATQRYSSPEIPIGSPVMSRTTSEPSDGRSRKMVANVAGCRSFCTFRDCHTSIAFTPVGPQPNLAHIFGWIWD